MARQLDRSIVSTIACDPPSASYNMMTGMRKTHWMLQGFISRPVRGPGERSCPTPRRVTHPHITNGAFRATLGADAH